MRGDQGVAKPGREEHTSIQSVGELLKPVQCAPALRVARLLVAQEVGEPDAPVGPDHGVGLVPTLEHADERRPRDREQIGRLIRREEPVNGRDGDGDGVAASWVPAMPRAGAATPWPALLHLDHDLAPARGAAFLALDRQRDERAGRHLGHRPPPCDLSLIHI